MKTKVKIQMGDGHNIKNLQKAIARDDIFHKDCYSLTVSREDSA